jgi:hypothetical protein
VKARRGVYLYRVSMQGTWPWHGLVAYEMHGCSLSRAARGTRGKKASQPAQLVATRYYDRRPTTTRRAQLAASFLAFSGAAARHLDRRLDDSPDR